MNEALLAICENGQASDLAAFAVSENRRALLLDMTPNTPNTSRYLTSDFKATTPGDFYYAICTTAKVKELKVCEYLCFCTLSFKFDNIGLRFLYDLIYGLRAHEIAQRPHDITRRD